MKRTRIRRENGFETGRKPSGKGGRVGLGEQIQARVHVVLHLSSQASPPPPHARVCGYQLFFRWWRWGGVGEKGHCPLRLHIVSTCERDHHSGGRGGSASKIESRGKPPRGIGAKHRSSNRSGRESNGYRAELSFKRFSEIAKTHWHAY